MQDVHYSVNFIDQDELRIQNELRFYIYLEYHKDKSTPALSTLKIVTLVQTYKTVITL